MQPLSQLIFILQLILIDLHRNKYISGSGTVLYIPMFCFLGIFMLAHLCGIIWQIVTRFIVPNMEKTLTIHAFIYNLASLLFYTIAFSALCFVNQLTNPKDDDKSFGILMGITLILACIRTIINQFSREMAMI